MKRASGLSNLAGKEQGHVLFNGPSVPSRELRFLGNEWSLAVNV